MGLPNKSIRMKQENKNSDINKEMKIIRSLTPEELEAYIQTNYLIKERNYYGRRIEIVKNMRKSTICTWFNGSKRWYCRPFTSTGYYEKRMREISLDANQILTPYPYKTVKKFEECLLPLPLYYYSVEAKERGEVDQLEAIFCWVLKQLEREKYSNKE